MSTIPASQLVSVTPNVLAAGGSALDLNGLILTLSTRVPIGSVLSFPSQAQVSAYFGAGSTEAALATIYFKGFDNSSVKPGRILFAQYPKTAVAAYLRGGNISQLALSALQAISGTFTITIDGHVFPATVNLSAATSFSSAATIIQTALNSANPGGGAVSPTVTYDSVSGAFLIDSGTTGGTSTMSFATGTISDDLLLIQSLGAILSQGAAATSPAAFMDSVVLITQNWASFMTNFDPDSGSGNTVRLAFAAWVSGKGNRYAYVCSDSDITATNSDPANSSLGILIRNAGYSGIALVWSPTASDFNLAAFVCGVAASIDFEQTDGRVTFAGRSQSGLTPTVTDATSALNLIDNGYNFYGAYATANDQFLIFQTGSISGEFDWLDSFYNQIWLNNAFQLALMNLLTQAKSIPYNPAGYSLIEAACSDPINQGLNFGAFRPGVTLSAAQIAAVNAAAGTQIDTVLAARGWYLQVSDASPSVRQNRGSPPCTFWYMDGESVQKINLTSVELQ